MEKQPASNYLSFTGKGFDLLGIWLVNLILTILTLGIYSLWAKVRITKFFHENTWFLGNNFEFHATGAERGKGFIKAIFIFIVVGIALIFIQGILAPTIGPGVASGFVSVLTVVLITALTPLIAVGKRRYLLSRTSWRNVRFRFTGGIWNLSKINIMGTLLSFLTLGIYLPFYQVRRKQFYMEHSFYGNEAFYYTGEGQELLYIMLKGIFLSIITLGFYGFWYRAQTYNYHWNHTCFQGKLIQSKLTGTDLLITSILSMLVVLCTLGIGIPWALIMQRKVKLEALGYEGEPDLASIQGTVDQGANALADGLSDASEAVDVIGDIFT